MTSRRRRRTISTRPRCDLGSLRLRALERREEVPLSTSPTSQARTHPALQHHFANMEQQKRLCLARHVDVPGHRNHVLRRPVLRLPDLPACPLHDFAAASSSLDIRLGAVNTGVLLLSSLTVVLAVQRRAARQAQAARRSIWSPPIVLGLTFLGVKAIEYHRKFARASRSGPELQFRRRARCRRPAAPSTSSTRRCSSRSTS